MMATKVMMMTMVVVVMIVELVVVMMMMMLAMVVVMMPYLTYDEAKHMSDKKHELILELLMLSLLSSPS